MDDYFDDLDKRFYKLDSELNKTERIAEFILSDPTLFYFEGEIKVPL